MSNESGPEDNHKCSAVKEGQRCVKMSTNVYLGLYLSMLNRVSMISSVLILNYQINLLSVGDFWSRRSLLSIQNEVYYDRRYRQCTVF